MKVLLDACVPRPLRKYLPDHSVHTAQEMGWAQLKNGALLQEAESRFEAFITTDQNLRYQQKPGRQKNRHPRPAYERLAGDSSEDRRDRRTSDRAEAG